MSSSKFPRGHSGRKGVCGRRPKSRYGRYVQIRLPERLIPAIRLIVAAIEFMDSIGVSILPSILTAVAQDVCLHGWKPCHARRDTRPLVAAMVDMCAALQGNSAPLSSIDFMVLSLDNVLDAALNQRPATKEEMELFDKLLKEPMSAKKPMSANKPMSAMDKSATKRPPSKRKAPKAAKFKGFGLPPRDPDLN